MTAPTTQPQGYDSAIDPREALAAITDRFKKAHGSVILYNKTAAEFITDDCIKHLADLEELMSILCFAHEVAIEVTV